MSRLVVSAILVVSMGCGEAPGGLTPREVLQLPEAFPEPPIPSSNPLTREKIELGRFLFYDPRLSGNGSQSCSSCHLQALAFSDKEVLPRGSTGEELPRNSPGLANVAYNATLTWANPILRELESQLLIPIFGDNPVELGASSGGAEVLGRFSQDPRYPPLFAAAFPEEEEPITWNNVVRALASFCRALISFDSPYDRFVYGRDAQALSSSAQRGMELFFSERLECHHCHGGFNFTNSTVHADTVFDAALFHNTGLYNLDGDGAYPAGNTGVHEITGDPRDMGMFRAPSLRNVAMTAPYMHDGSMETLEEVIRFYEAGGRVIPSGPYAGDGRLNPLKSGFVAGFTLTDEERDDVLQFLESLTDPTFLTDPRLGSPFK